MTKTKIKKRLLRIIRRHYAFVVAEESGGKKAFAHWEGRKTPCEDEYVKELSKEIDKAVKKALAKEIKLRESSAKIYLKAIDKARKEERERVIKEFINREKAIKTDWKRYRGSLSYGEFVRRKLKPKQDK